ncbi:MAG: polyprenyl synthetase family protein [Solirubrobacteraceae bacterium]
MSSPGVATVEAVVGAVGADTGLVMARVEARMAELVVGHGATLAHHGRETIAAGGKRLRPLLVCVASGVPVAVSDALVRAAVAVELVHAATLVHDDVIDGSDLRRGRPTVVATGGRLMALATGDLLLSRAFAELAAGGEIEPVRVLSAAASQLAEGELMQRRDAWRPDVTQERYLQRCRLKTAVLFRAACVLGGMAGGGQTAALARYGERVGIAFQLLDDVLDVTGPPERTGKPRGADLLDGTVTLPLIEARHRDPELARLDLRSVRGADRAAEICDRIEALGALEFAREHALSVVAEAKAELPDEMPETQRAALELVADGVVERYS